MNESPATHASADVPVVAPAARLHALDGLRGVAAMIVVIAHSYNSFTLPIELRGQIAHSPLALLQSSTGAVQLFFVLSGYVLTGSFARTSGLLGGLQFWVRRILRIHPPYLAALAFAWLASFYYVPVPRQYAQGFASLIDQVHLTAAQLLHVSRFPGSAGGQLPVGWTLQVEMIFSLLLPVMVVVARRIHWSLLFLGSAACLYWFYRAGPLVYAIDFSLGIAIYLERERIAALMARLPKPAGWAWLAASLVLFSAPIAFWPEVMMDVYVVPPSWRDIVVLGVASAALVIGASTLPVMARPLEWPWVQYLGKLSFSLYLTHYTFILLFMPLTERPTTFVSAVLFLGAVMMCSVVVSDLSYRWVELPSIRLGSAICRWIDRWRGSPVSQDAPGHTRS